MTRISTNLTTETSPHALQRMAPQLHWFSAMKSSWKLLLVLSLGLNGCGSPDEEWWETDYEYYGGPSRFRDESANDREAGWMKRRFSFDFDGLHRAGPQAQSVVMLLSTKNNSVDYGQCTGTLVAPDTVLTNRHCLPQDIAHSGAFCKDRILVGFSDGRKIDCHRVLSASVTESGEGHILAADYAFIRLAENASVAPIGIDSQSGELRENLSLTVIDFDEYMLNGNIRGTIVKKTCAPIQHSMYLAYSMERSGMVTDQCGVRDGNSGSAYVSDSGQVVGVVHSHIKAEYRSFVFSRFRSFFTTIEFETYGFSNDIAFGTMMKDLDATSFKIPEGQIPGTTDAMLAHFLNQKIDSKVAAYEMGIEHFLARFPGMAALVQDNPEIIWKSGSHPYKLVVAPKIQCLRSRVNQTEELKFDGAIASPKFSVGRNSGIKARIDHEVTGKIVYAIHPLLRFQQGAARVKTTFLKDGYTYLSEEISDEIVPVCK